MSGLFVTDGENETPWEFDCVNEQTDFGMSEELHGHYGVKVPDGMIMMANATYRWPIWIRIDREALSDCKYMELKINSRGRIIMLKKPLTEGEKKEPGQNVPINVRKEEKPHGFCARAGHF